MNQRAAPNYTPEPSREKWYRWLFRLGIFFKGFDGLLETAGGTLFLIVGSATIKWSLLNLAQRHMLQSPDDWIAESLRHAYSHFSTNSKLFASVYLLGHGLLKMFLAVSLLREHLWAFPTAMVILGGFIGYQSYHLTTRFSWLLLSLTALDVVIFGLIWHEMRSLKRRKRGSSGA